MGRLTLRKRAYFQTRSLFYSVTPATTLRPEEEAGPGLLSGAPEWGSSGRRGPTPAGEETRSGLLLRPEWWPEQKSDRVWKYARFLSVSLPMTRSPQISVSPST